MLQRFALMCALPLLLGLLVCAASKADNDQPRPVDPAALVGQLGADSYAVREAAYAELSVLGKAAKQALEDGLLSDDPEIRSRCSRLLRLLARTDIEVVLHAMLDGADMKTVQNLSGWQRLQPLWERFCKLLGEDQSARTLFVEMYSSESALFTSLENNPRTFNATFNRRCTQIQQNLFTPTGETTPIPLGQIVGLLFAATDPRAVTATPAPEPGTGKGKGRGPRTNLNNVFIMMTSLLDADGLQEGFRANAGARKLLVHFFDQRSDESTLPQALQLGAQLEIKEMTPLVLKTVNNKSAKGPTRASALMALAKLGSKENVKDIEPLLSETTNLGTMQLGRGTRITTQLRDVALAAMITLSGQSLTEYDFPYLKTLALQQEEFLVYNFLGFSDQMQRDRALKKFKESQEKEKK